MLRVQLVAVADLPFGEIEQDDDVADKLAGERLEREPANRGRDPPLLVALPFVAAGARAHLRGHADLVDPDEPVRLSGLQRPRAQLRGLGDERVPGVANPARDPPPGDLARVA